MLLDQSKLFDVVLVLSIVFLLGNFLLVWLFRLVQNVLIGMYTAIDELTRV